MTAAPWHYFALLLPLIYLYRVVPAALGVTLIMLLMRILPPRRLYQVLAVGNFLLGGLSLYFFLGGQQALLAGWAVRLADAERILWGFPPLAAMRDLILGLMGGNVGLWLPLIILPGSVIVFMAMVLAVIEHLYFHNFERLQTAEKRSPKKVSPSQDTARATRVARLPLLWFLVREHWRTASRNQEMFQAGISFIVLLLVYMIALERFAGGLPWVMLLNVAAVAFCAHLATLLLFIPYAMAADRLALQRQYWFYKVAPVEGKAFAGSLFLAHCLPSLALALLLLVPVSYFTGFTGGAMFPAAGLLALLVIS